MAEVTAGLKPVENSTEVAIPLRPDSTQPNVNAEADSLAQSIDAAAGDPSKVEDTVRQFADELDTTETIAGAAEAESTNVADASVPSDSEATNSLDPQTELATAEEDLREGRVTQAEYSKRVADALGKMDISKAPDDTPKPADTSQSQPPEQTTQSADTQATKDSQAGRGDRTKFNPNLTDAQQQDAINALGYGKAETTGQPADATKPQEQPVPVKDVQEQKSKGFFSRLFGRGGSSQPRHVSDAPATDAQKLEAMASLGYEKPQQTLDAMDAARKSNPDTAPRHRAETTESGDTAQNQPVSETTTEVQSPQSTEGTNASSKTTETPPQTTTPESSANPETEATTPPTAEAQTTQDSKEKPLDLEMQQRRDALIDKMKAVNPDFDPEDPDVKSALEMATENDTNMKAMETLAEQFGGKQAQEAAEALGMDAKSLAKGSVEGIMANIEGELARLKKALAEGKLSGEDQKKVEKMNWFLRLLKGFGVFFKEMALASKDAAIAGFKETVGIDNNDDKK